MSWMFVIEDNQAVFAQIREAIEQIDPKIALIQFANKDQFLDWMTNLSDQKPVSPAIPSGNFLGIVTAVESWKFRDLKLIGKFKALFVQKKLAATEDELCVVFTGYAAEAAHKKRYEERSINNFIFKPVDKIVLKQMLGIALCGRQQIGNYYVHNYKTDVKIEMLKEIRLTELTELGFQTVSDQSIDPGKIAKYYAGFLATQQHRSALAQVLRVNPIPAEKKFRVDLRFFALDQQQSFNLQKLVQKERTTRPLEHHANKHEYEFIFLPHPKNGLALEVSPSIERFFDHTITGLTDISKLAHELHPPDEKIREAKALFKRRFLFIDAQWVAGNEVVELQGLVNACESKNLSIMLLSPRIFPEKLEFELSTVCEDVFYAPFNRSYIIKGLKQRWPDMRVKEEIYESQRTVEETMHVSNPVRMVELSEAGLAIEYYRDISVGSFREFVFWMPNEAVVPTLTAQCNFTEQVQGKKSYRCHFVFFGLNDEELKFIRLWMLHNYVEKKQKDA
jgi:hypothetical protein